MNAAWFRAGMPRGRVTARYAPAGEKKLLGCVTEAGHRQLAMLFPSRVDGQSAAGLARRGGTEGVVPALGQVRFQLFQQRPWRILAA